LLSNAVCEPFGCTPAAMPMGSSLWKYYEIGRYLPLPLQVPRMHPEHAGLHRLFPLSPYLEYAPRSGLVQAQPADIYITLYKPIQAQHILFSIVTKLLIWNGSYSCFGLLHTTFICLP
jgi:hypothetical protein